MRKQILLRSLGALALSGCVLISCSKDDNESLPAGPSTPAPQTKADSKMLLVVGKKTDNPREGFKYGTSLRFFGDYDQPKTLSIYEASDATNAHEAFTQVAYNAQSKSLMCFVYAGGAKEQDENGNAMDKSARVYSYSVAPEQSSLSFLGRVNLRGNFMAMGTLGSGFYGTSSSAAVTLLHQAAQGASVDINTNLDLEQYKEGDVTPSIASILDLGAGQALVALNYTPQVQGGWGGGRPGGRPAYAGGNAQGGHGGGEGYHGGYSGDTHSGGEGYHGGPRAAETGADAGTTEHNALAFVDHNLHVESVIKSDKIGPSFSGQRSARYQLLATNGAGDVYVFSGSSSKIGALRIKKGTKVYDGDYYFDIAKASGGYGFRRVYHITGDYFLLECYNEAGKHGNMDAASKLAVINVSTQSFAWVTGIAEQDITTTFAESNGEYIYIPVSPKASADAIYRIDPKTAAATKVVTLGESDYAKAVVFVR